MSNVTKISGMNYSYFNTFYVSPLDIQDFTSIRRKEFEVTDQELKSFNSNSFIVGLFDEKIVKMYLEFYDQSQYSNKLVSKG